MKSDLPDATIKPAYPLGDANADVNAAPASKDKKDTPTEPAPKSDPKKVDEPQTDGE